jgi:hypothetical protein
LLLCANDLGFSRRKSPKDLQMVPLTRKGVIERDGMCSIRAGGDGRQSGPPVRWRGGAMGTAALRRSAASLGRDADAGP